MIECGDTSLLVTATKTTKKEAADFLPLICDYEEKLYAAGRIPGGFMRREGRPPERATLIARLIDRPMRPLFPSWMAPRAQENPGTGPGVWAQAPVRPREGPVSPKSGVQPEVQFSTRVFKFYVTQANEDRPHRQACNCNRDDRKIYENMKSWKT